jgi:hypothetical protein
MGILLPKNSVPSWEHLIPSGTLQALNWLRHSLKEENGVYQASLNFDMPPVGTDREVAGAYRYMDCTARERLGTEFLIESPPQNRRPFLH